MVYCSQQRDLGQSLRGLIETLWRRALAAPEYLALLESVTTSPTPADPTEGEQFAAQFFALPGLCCAALGGTAEDADQVAAAWALLSRGAHILDHVQDDDPETGPLARLAPGQRINLAVGLIASSSLLLLPRPNDRVGASCWEAIHADFDRTVLEMCSGQHEDLTLRQPSLEQCWAAAERKSGSFFGLACRAGARLTSEDKACLAGFDLFGRQLGIIVQIADDLSGLRQVDGTRSDLASRGSWTLPIAYAVAVLPDNSARRLAECLELAPDSSDAEDEARRAIVASGALLYFKVETEKRRRQATAQLQSVAPASGAREALLSLLDELAQRSSL